MHSKIFFRKPVLEEYGYILDIFEGSRIIKVKRVEGGVIEKNISGLIGQILGEECFTLMEFTLSKNVLISPLERIYIGKGPRVKANRFIRLIRYRDLTMRAKENLVSALEKIITFNEELWVDFFNNAGPINIRTHTLELLKSIGKKTVSKIISERESRPFNSFEDIKNRVGIDPVKAIIERILSEMKEDQLYYIFICGK